MTPPSIETSTREERQTYVRKKWECHHQRDGSFDGTDIVLEENDAEQDTQHERPYVYLFVKTFQKEDGSKYVHFESVTVSQDGMEVSISSHIIRENQLKNKIKNDRLLYKATALDASATTSAEQPIEGGSLSSEGKGTEISGTTKETEEKSSGTEEKIAIVSDEQAKANVEAVNKEMGENPNSRIVGTIKGIPSKGRFF